MAKNRKASHDPVEVDVDLREDSLSHDGVKRLVVQLVKHLLFQRKQVPCSVDNIKKDVEAGPPPVPSPRGPLTGGPAKVQEQLRQKRLAAKQMRTREKYLKRAKVFVDNCLDFEDELMRHLDRHTARVSCVFGASPAHPKEVYTIELPSATSLIPVSSEKASRKALLALFRSLTTNDKLFQMFGTTSVPSTNLFVAFSKPASLCSGLVTRAGFKTPPQCRHVVIRIRQQTSSDLCLATPVQPTRFTSIGSTCTPVPMDLCTPLVRSNRQKFQPMTPGGADWMMETPCVKRKCSAITEDDCPVEEKRSSLEMDHSDAVMMDYCQTGSDQWYFLPQSLKGFTFPKC